MRKSLVFLMVFFCIFFYIGLVPCQATLDCSGAIEIKSSQWGVLIAGETSGSSNVDYYQGTEGPFDGPETIYKVIIPEFATELSAALTNKSSSDLNVIIIKGCDPEELQTYDSEEARTYDVNQGTYYIIVDGKNKASGTYTLTVKCTPATKIKCGDSVSDATSGSDKVSHYDCVSWSESGPEKVYKLTTYEQDDLTVTLSNVSSYGLDVFVVDSWGEDSFKCLAHSDLSGEYPSAVLYNAPAGNYYVVVDGSNGASGSYTLDVSCSNSSDVYFNGYTIDDSVSGNNNGLADPGETIKLKVKLKNVTNTSKDVLATLKPVDDSGCISYISPQVYKTIENNSIETFEYTVTLGACTNIGNVGMNLDIVVFNGSAAPANFTLPINNTNTGGGNGGTTGGTTIGGEGYTPKGIYYTDSKGVQNEIYNFAKDGGNDFSRSDSPVTAGSVAEVSDGDSHICYFTVIGKKNSLGSCGDGPLARAAIKGYRVTIDSTGSQSRTYLFGGEIYGSFNEDSTTYSNNQICIVGKDAYFALRYRRYLSGEPPKTCYSQYALCKKTVLGVRMLFCKSNQSSASEIYKNEREGTYQDEDDGKSYYRIDKIINAAGTIYFGMTYRLYHYTAEGTSLCPNSSQNDPTEIGAEIRKYNPDKDKESVQVWSSVNDIDFPHATNNDLKSNFKIDALEPVNDSAYFGITYALFDTAGCSGSGEYNKIGYKVFFAPHGNINFLRQIEMPNAEIYNASSNKEAHYKIEEFKVIDGTAYFHAAHYVADNDSKICFHNNKNVGIETYEICKGKKNDGLSRIDGTSNPICYSNTNLCKECEGTAFNYVDGKVDFSFTDDNGNSHYHSPFDPNGICSGGIQPPQIGPLTFTANSISGGYVEVNFSAQVTDWQLKDCELHIEYADGGLFKLMNLEMKISDDDIGDNGATYTGSGKIIFPSLLSYKVYIVAHDAQDNKATSAAITLDPNTWKGNDYSNPISLSCGDSRTGYTGFGKDATDYYCFSDKWLTDVYSGPEQVYSYVIPPGTTENLTATLTNYTANLKVFILDEQKTLLANGENGKALYKNAPAGKYYIVVDGSNGAYGSYDLTVNYTYYQDNDNDGFGDPINSTRSCTAPAGYVRDNTDCEDNNAMVTTTKTWCLDYDGDGSGDPAKCQVGGCTPPPQVLIDGKMRSYVDNAKDCNDNDPLVTVVKKWYRDADGDGYGDSQVYTWTCSNTPPAGYVRDNTDCDDHDYWTHPGAFEKCDGRDNDCSCAGKGSDCVDPTPDSETEVWDWVTNDTNAIVAACDSKHPSMAVDKSGNVHVVWEYITRDENGTHVTIDYTRRDSNGQWLLPYQFVAADSPDSLGAKISPISNISMFVDENNEVHVAWVGTEYSSDNVSTAEWGIYYTRFRVDDNGSMNYIVNPTRVTNGSLFKPIVLSNPSLVVDRYGNVHIAWIAQNADVDNYSIYGISFQYDEATNKFYYDGDNRGVLLKYGNTCNLAVDPEGSNLYLVWSQITSYKAHVIAYSRLGFDDSSLGNACNRETAHMKIVNLGLRDGVNPVIGVDSQENVHIVWSEKIADNKREIYYSELTGYNGPTGYNGQTKILPTRITYAKNLIVAPRITVDSKDKVHIAWLDTRNASESGLAGDILGEVFYSKLEAVAGTNIYTVRALTYDTRLTFKLSAASSPLVGVDGSGIVHVIWEDNRNCGQNSSNHGHEIYYLDGTNKPCDKTTCSWRPEETYYLKDQNGNGNPLQPVRAFSKTDWLADSYIHTACTPYTWYKDIDNDGYSDGTTITSCTRPVGYKLASELTVVPNAADPRTIDCDDTDYNTKPSTIWYKDIDNDGYTDGTTITSCTRPTGYKLASELKSTTIMDCNDTDPNVNLPAVWYKDMDNDGYSDGTTITSCTRPVGYKLESELISTNGDCDDGDKWINPKTVWYKDYDGDRYAARHDDANGPAVKIQCERPDARNANGGYYYFTADFEPGYRYGHSWITTGGDCDDTDSNVHPGATEICNGKDNDCDGSVEWKMLVKDRTLIQGNSPSESQLVIDSSGNLNLVWVDRQSYESDNGSTYDRDDIFYAKLSVTEDSSGYTINKVVTDTNVTGGDSGLYHWYPTMAVDASNNVYIAWERSTLDLTGNWEIYYSKLDSNGHLLTPTVLTRISYAGGGWKLPSLGVDKSGNVHIAWENGGGIYYTKLDSEGYILIDSTRLARAEGSLGLSLSLGVDSSGNVHIVWTDNNDIYYIKLDNNGVKLVDAARLTYAGDCGSPVLKLDNADNVHIAWVDNRDGKPEIYYKKLDKNGVTLVDDTRLTYANAVTGDSPSLTIDSAGNVHIVWTDTRNGWSEIYYTKLNNNGAALLDNVRLTFNENSSSPQVAVDNSGKIHIVSDGLTYNMGITAPCSDSDWPVTPSNPQPADRSKDACTGISLHWANSTGAMSYDVYLGSANPPTNLVCADTNITTCNPGTLSANTTYYWRVSAKNGLHNALSPIWSFTTACGENIRRVPGEYSSIQSAINAASGGDTVLVSDGVYYENINFKGKAIKVKSVNGAANTIINGQAADTVVSFISSERSGTVLDGFTITNGSGTNGGGIYCYKKSSPLICNNIIINNKATAGGGIACQDYANPTVKNNSIVSNEASNGGGIWCDNYSAPGIARNTIRNNKAASGNGGGIWYSNSSSSNWNTSSLADNIISDNTADIFGGGIYCDNAAPYIANNLVARNSAGNSGGGLYAKDSGHIWDSDHYAMVSVINNTITANTGGIYGIGSVFTLQNDILWSNGREIYGDDYTNYVSTLYYSDIQGGYLDMENKGNIDSDPLFLGNGDYRLSFNSPCIDKGNSLDAPTDDIDGNVRPLDSGYDMGAYEYNCPADKRMTLYRDADGDGFGDPSNSIQVCYQPAGYVNNALDCDDTNAEINPNIVWYKDIDNDGYTDGTTITSCTRPTGYKLASELKSTTIMDCNDADPNVNLPAVWYKDMDNDGYSDGTTITSCTRPDNYKLASELKVVPNAADPRTIDCDDTNPNIHPMVYYLDKDGDGYGDRTKSIVMCNPAGSAPEGYVTNARDINDNDPNVYPSSPGGDCPTYDSVPQVKIYNVVLHNNYPNNIDLEFSASVDFGYYYSDWGKKLRSCRVFVYTQGWIWLPLADASRGTALCEEITDSSTYPYGSKRYRISANAIGYNADSTLSSTPVNLNQGFFIGYDLGTDNSLCYLGKVMADGTCSEFTGQEGQEINPSAETAQSWMFSVTSPYPLTRLTNGSTVNHKSVSIEGNMVVWPEVTEIYSNQAFKSDPTQLVDLADMNIVAYDLNQNMKSTLIHRTGLQYDPSDPYGSIGTDCLGIDKGRIVWGEINQIHSHGSTDWSVYMYDLNQVGSTLDEGARNIVSHTIGWWPWAQCVDISGNYIAVMGDGIYNINSQPGAADYHISLFPLSINCPSIYGNRMTSYGPSGILGVNGISLYSNIFSAPIQQNLISSIYANNMYNCTTLKGDYVVFVDKGNRIYLYRISTGTRTLVAQGISPIINMRALDGNRIVFTDQNDFYMVTLDNSVCTATFYRDADGDGFGDPNDTIRACTPPVGYVGMYEHVSAPNTPAGQNIIISLSNAGTVATLTFDDVTSSGQTNLIIYSQNQGPTIPSNFQLLGVNYYDISTTAQFTGNITVCLAYDSTNLTPVQEQTLRLLHYNATTLQWDDITISLDTINHIICGQVSSLSPFVIVYSLTTTPTITWSNPVDITYGTALSGTQLNATSSVTGTFIYTPAAGTVLNIACSQNLHVDFIPNDATDYNNASADVAINVVATWYKDANGDGYSDSTKIVQCTRPGPAYYLASQLIAISGDYCDSVNVGSDPRNNTMLYVAASTIGSGDGSLANPCHSIQQAINTANCGDTILVSTGIYTENIHFLHKSIKVMGSGASTVIDGYGRGPAVTFDSGENKHTILDGFTIRNGTGADIGNNLTAGGGIWVSNGSSPLIVNNIIYSNRATYGGGIYCVGASPTIMNNTIVDNLAISGGAIAAVNNSSPQVTNSILWSNVNEAIFLYSSAITVTYSDIESGYIGGGNINANPLFEDAANRNYYLQYGSPCINTGIATSASTTDIDGISRPQGPGYDMGAYEIPKGVPTITWSNPADIAYGTALSGTQLNATASVPGTFTYRPAFGTMLSAGRGQTLHVDFVPDNTNIYTGASAEATINVMPRTITITADAKSKTYGTADPALTYTYTPALVGSDGFTGALIRMTGENAGTYAILQGTLTLNPNYTLSYVKAAFIINKATAMVSLSNLTQTYSGNALYPTATTNPPGLAIAWTNAPQTAAGSYNVTATVNDLNYQGSASGTFTINKATPIIAWNNPADTVYGTDLSATQLNATASVPGTFVYNPAAGTTLNAGNNQALSVIFTPTDTNNYNNVSTSVTINVAKANQTIGFGALTDRTYGDADFSVNAVASSGLAVTFTATGNCTISGNVVHITGAGSGTLTAHQSGSSNYNVAPDVSQTFAIAKATPTITWSNLTDIVYGTALSGTQLNAAASVSGTFTYTPVAGTVLNAGNGQTLSVTFTPNDTTDYNSASTNVTINVSQANATVNINGYTGYYDGSAHGATGTATGVNNADLSSLLNLGAAFTNIPGGTASWTFNSNSTDPNYKSASGSVAITINPKAASVTPSAASKTYGDNDPTLTGVLTGFLSSDNVTATYNRTAGEAAGTYTISATLSTSAILGNYSITYNAASFTINKRSITVTADAKNKVYGDNDPALTYQITNGSLAFGDTFTGNLTRVIGENTGAYAIGQGTLALSANYTLTYIGANLTINKATQTITWSNPADITYGTALSATQLNATASVPGTFVYNPTAGTILNTGNGQTLSVIFTPDDTNNYNSASKSVNINVLNAQKTIATVTLSNLTQTYTGGLLSPTVTTNPVGLTIVWTNAPRINAGSYVVKVMVSDPNYIGSATGTFIINKATPIITWGNPADIIYGTALSGVQLNAAASVPGTYSYTPAAGTTLNLGCNQTLHVDFTPADTGNYNNASATVTINVGAVWYKDADNDGYTDGTTAIACTRPAGYKLASELNSITSLDCNDNDPTFHPGAVDVCENGIPVDKNCDGKIEINPYNLIAQIKSAINNLACSEFKNNCSNRKNAFSQKLDALSKIISSALSTIDPNQRNMLLQDVENKLSNDIMAKMDGCSGGNSNDDWITGCTGQAAVYPLCQCLYHDLEDLKL